MTPGDPDKFANVCNFHPVVAHGPPFRARRRLVPLVVVDLGIVR